MAIKYPLGKPSRSPSHLIPVSLPGKTHPAIPSSPITTNSLHPPTCPERMPFIPWHESHPSHPIHPAPSPSAARTPRSCPPLHSTPRSRPTFLACPCHPHPILPPYCAIARHPCPSPNAPPDPVPKIHSPCLSCPIPAIHPITCVAIPRIASPCPIPSLCPAVTPSPSHPSHSPCHSSLPPSPHPQHPVFHPPSSHRPRLCIVTPSVPATPFIHPFTTCPSPVTPSRPPRTASPTSHPPSHLICPIPIPPIYPSIPSVFSHPVPDPSRPLPPRDRMSSEIKGWVVSVTSKGQ